MTANEVSTLIRDAGGEGWNVTPQKEGLVLYADINRIHCRIIIHRPGQYTPKGSVVPSFLTHIVTDISSLKEWLSQITPFF
jgi:hypothetical protein